VSIAVTNRSLTAWSAGFGAVVGAALWVLPVANPGPVGDTGRLALWAVLVVVPLLLGLPVAGPAPLLRLAVQLQPVGALLAAVSLLVPTGTTAGLLTVPWVVVCGLVALDALVRGIRDRRTLGVSDVVEAAGCLMLPIGAGWLVLARAGIETGYGPLITTLTAAHFHAAAFAAPVWAGRLGALTQARWTRAIHRVLAVGLVAGTPLVAAGIAGVPVVEGVGVALLTGSALGLAVLALGLAVRVPEKAAGVLLGLSALALGVGMVWAVRFHFGDWLGTAPVTIPAMLSRHGAVNVVGFATLGALALRRMGGMGDGLWQSGNDPR